MDNSDAAKIQRLRAWLGSQPQRLTNPLPPPFLEPYRPYGSGGEESGAAVRAYADCGANWNQYYRNNTVNGYKDRHYILREFVELRRALVGSDRSPADDDAPGVATVAPVAVEEGDAVAPGKRNRELDAAGPVSMIELGCGVGNTILPLLEAHAHLHATAVDISSVAVSLLQREAAARGVADRVSSGVVDISVQAVPNTVLATPADFASLVFVLCSIPAERRAAAVRHVAQSLRVGGVLFFRDYAVGDMACARFVAAERHVAEAGEENTFARSNGTLSHFFAEAELHSLFVESGCFEVVELKRVERNVVNRKEGTEMPRLWWQARFRKRG